MVLLTSVRSKIEKAELRWLGHVEKMHKRKNYKEKMELEARR